jgi:hypothetical protein
MKNDYFKHSVFDSEIADGYDYQKKFPYFLIEHISEQKLQNFSQNGFNASGYKRSPIHRCNKYEFFPNYLHISEIFPKFAAK